MWLLAYYRRGPCLYTLCGFERTLQRAWNKGTLTTTRKTTVASKAAPRDDPTTMNSPWLHVRPDRVDDDDGMRTGFPSGTAASTSTTTVKRLSEDLEGLPPSCTPTVSSNVGTASTESVTSGTTSPAAGRPPTSRWRWNSAGDLT